MINSLKEISDIYSSPVQNFQGIREFIMNNLTINWTQQYLLQFYNFTILCFTLNFSLDYRTNEEKMVIFAPFEQKYLSIFGNIMADIQFFTL